MKFYLSILTAGLIVVACTTSEVVQKENKSKKEAKELASVIQPLDIDPGAETYTINVAAGDTIFAPSGSTILFPSNAFVDANGNPVTGEVDIAWQEFHTLGDILASGIPMKYDSAGVQNDLESGGMFTIKGTHNGEPVEIAPDKSVEVNLASLQDTPCYNFYELDEQTGDWEYKTTKNGEKVNKTLSDKEVTPLGTIFEMQLNQHQYPELANMNILGWKATKSLKPQEKRFVRAPNTKVRIAQKNSDGTYELEAVGNKETQSYKVNPYTEEQALADSRTNETEFNEMADELVAYRENVASGKVIRSMNITGFGTYNWDKIYNREGAVTLLARFKYPEGINSELVTLKLVVPDRNFMVTCNSIEHKGFSFEKGERNVLVGITDQNELVSFSNDKFNAVRSKSDGSEHVFELEATGIKLESPEDIMKYLNELI